MSNQIEWGTEGSWYGVVSITVCDGGKGCYARWYTKVQKCASARVVVQNAHARNRKSKPTISNGRSNQRRETGEER